MNLDEKISLLDLIDIEFLQEFQDSFAEIMHVASLAVDDNGPITKPSNFTDFCIKYTRCSKEGYERCNKCDIEWGNLAAKKGEPVIYTCHSGLTDFAVPIMLDDKHIASILGGQVLTHKPDEEHFRKLARELGINEEEYIQAVRKIAVVTPEHVDAAAKFLFLVANSISKIAKKNYELIKINKIEKEITKREIILREIVEKLRSTIVPQEIKEYFVDLACNYFSADRCLFLTLEQNTGKILPFSYEIKKNAENKSMLELNVEEEFPEFCARVKRGKNVIIPSVKKVITRKNFHNYKSIQNIINYGVKSEYSVVVKHKETIWGILIMEFLESERILNNEELNFLKVLTAQAGIALYQATLFKEKEDSAKKEMLLRHIMLSSVESFNFQEIIKNIVTVTGKYFKADRCFYVEVDEATMSSLPIKEYAQFLSSPDIISHINRTPTSEETWAFTSVAQNGSSIYVQNINQIELPQQTAHLLIDDLAVKSYLIVPLIYENRFYGAFVLHYVKNFANLNEKDIEIAEAIGKQTSIIINQAKLYENQKKIAHKEKLLREITEAIRKTLDFEKTKKIIVDIIGKTLGADRSYIVEFNSENNKFQVINDEYRSSENILSYKGINPEKDLPNFANAIKCGHPILIKNKKLLMDVEGLDFEEEKKMIEKYNINSQFTFPLYHHNDLLGSFSVQYVDEKRIITDDEVEFLNLLANQVALALYQSRLYNKIQLQAERERISRNIIEILRSTLDINTIKSLFVKNIGKYFNADRVYFSQFDESTQKYKEIDSSSEYLSSSLEKSFIGFDFSNEVLCEFISPIMDRREVIIPNWKEFSLTNPISDELVKFLDKANIKSRYSFPVMYEGARIGFFSIQFTQKVVELGSEELGRIRSICAQAGIALYHAQLYLKAQEALKSTGTIINKVKHGIKNPVDNIIKSSKILSEQELEREIQLRLLGSIISSCNELLELTKNIEQN